MSVDPIERANLALCAGAVAASFAFATPAFAVSLALGGLLEALNFRGLRRAAQFLFWGQIRSAGGWTGVYALRFLWMVLGIGAALSFGADPAGLLVGLSLVMPAAILEAWRGRPPIRRDAAALAADDPEWDRWNPWLARERVRREETEA